MTEAGSSLSVIDDRKHGRFFHSSDILAVGDPFTVEIPNPVEASMTQSF